MTSLAAWRPAPPPPLPRQPTAPEAGTEAHSAPQADQGNGEVPLQAGEVPLQPESDERDENGRYLSREAARYRTQLRAAEAERDQLRAQLDRLQTEQVEQLAASAGLAVGKDVWTFGATLQTLRGEDGGVDREMVQGLVADIVKDRPGLRDTRGHSGIGHGDAARGPRPQKVGLSQLLKPGRA